MSQAEPATEADANSPTSTPKQLRALVRDDEEARELIEEGGYGYAKKINEKIIDRWGEDASPTMQSIYTAVQTVRKEIEDGEYDDVEYDDEEDDERREIPENLNRLSYNELQKIASDYDVAGNYTRDDLEAKLRSIRDDEENVSIEQLAAQEIEQIEGGAEATQVEKSPIRDDAAETEPDVEPEPDATPDEVDEAEAESETELEPEPETVEIAQIETAEIEEPSTTEERIQATILNDEELLRAAADPEQVDAEFIDQVQSTVRRTFGAGYTPTDDAVRAAVSELRLNGQLPSLGPGLDTGRGPANIVYVCELCGHEESSYKKLKHHIANEDDALHADRMASETHLIGTRGETIDKTHEAFKTGAIEAEVDDGFDLLWAIYQNPDARQKDICELLDISQPTLHRRLNELGIDWMEREDDVNELVDDLWDSASEPANVRRSVGNATYEGASTGVDTTSGHATRTLANRRVKATRQSLLVEIPIEEAKSLLTGTDDEAVKERVLSALLEAERGRAVESESENEET